MPFVKGLNINDFANFEPDTNSVAISFVSQNDIQYIPELYAKLPLVYAKYQAALTINADDIEQLVDDCQIFTMNDAQRIINFANRYSVNNIIVHCNAGVSRTGSVVKFLQEYYHYQIIGQQNFVSNQLIDKMLKQAYQKACQCWCRKLHFQQAQLDITTSR